MRRKIFQNLSHIDTVPLDNDNAFLEALHLYLCAEAFHHCLTETENNMYSMQHK